MIYLPSLLHFGHQFLLNRNTRFSVITEILRLNNTNIFILKKVVSKIREIWQICNDMQFIYLLLEITQ